MGKLVKDEQREVGKYNCSRQEEKEARYSGVWVYSLRACFGNQVWMFAVRAANVATEMQ